VKLPGRSAAALAGAAVLLSACVLDKLNYEAQPTVESLDHYEAQLAAAGNDVNHLPFLEREYLARVSTRVGELRYREISALPECRSVRVKRDLPDNHCHVIEFKDLGQCRRYAKLKDFVLKSGELPEYQKAARSAMINVARIGIVRYGLFQDYTAAMQSGTRKGLEVFIDRYGLHKDAATLMFPEPCELSDAKNLWESLVVREADLAERKLRDSGDKDWLKKAIETWKEAVDTLPFGVTREKALNRQRELELQIDEPAEENRSS